MAETAIIKSTATNISKNTLFDGDFIDLTSESEHQTQNSNQDDVAMLNEASLPQTEGTKNSSSVDACKKKLENANTAAIIKEATMIVSTAKNCQQFLIPVKLTTTPNGTRILVQPPFAKEFGQLVPQTEEEIKQQAAKAMMPQHKILPSGGSPVKKAAQNTAVLQNFVQKTTSKVGKNVGAILKPQSKCNQKSPHKTSLKKLGLKSNINPVAMHQRYRAVKPASSSLTVPTSATQDIDVEDIVLLPTSSETGFKEAIKQRYQDNMMVLNQSKSDEVGLLPSQSENRSKSKVVIKSVATITSPSSPTLQEILLKALPNSNSNLNNDDHDDDDDDDVIVISDDPKKEETKKPKETQSVLSLPVNILKQGQLGSVSNRVNKLPQKTISVQKKDSEKGYTFLSPQLALPNSQRKQNIPPKSTQSLTPVKKPSSVVLPKEHPAKPLLKSLQRRQARSNKDIASNAQELEIVEHEITMKEPENVGTIVPVEAIEGTVGDQQVYFLLCPLENNENSIKAIDGINAENCTVIPIDDIELNEPKLESDFDEVCTIESDKEDEDPLQHVVEPATVDLSDVVTPVDITEILNQGKMARKPELKDRCECVSLKNMNLYQKGFTKREMRKAYCVRYLQTFIKNEENKIRELKKSSFYKSNFIICGKTFNNFLPETSQCDEGDPEEYVIEYNNFEQRLSEEIYNSQTLPVITNVISKVNEEVLQLKSQHSKTKKRESEEDLQTKLAKPEAALKLIKRGLELIKSWSKETHLEKERANKSLPIPSRKRTAPVVEPKGKRYSAPIEIVVEPPKKVSRARKDEVFKKEVPKKKEAPRKNEPPPKKEAPKQRSGGGRKRTPTEKVQKANESVSNVKEIRKRKTEAPVEVKSPVKRGRKPKNKVDFDSVNDNELFLIKKVDILKGRRRK